ncbi:MAG TPA: 3-hydroxybutyryl-CoA dehydrogenase [Terriglobia bacterium]|jgi:3-hydroxybutyryl-CoA dehydrogenase|nr:3-hydroxybutyryl-CoA dehydrogenase [Terriglobia bacterium]
MTRSLDGSIRTVGVVGAGTMGHGIAHTFLRHGYAVFLHDTSSEFLQAGVVKIHKGLERDVEKGRLSTDQKGQAVASLRPVTDMAAFAGIDFAIEAVTENFEVKASIFRALDEACGPRVIFASNTSSISITKLAAVTHRPVRFVGLHFFNPVPVMKLVEVVAGLRTSPATMEAAVALAAAVGKTPVRANDFPGFVSNRVLMPMINEAVYCVMEGVAEPKAVDEVMKLGMNHPMGPLELADFIGLDVCLDIMKVLHDGFHDSKYRPCPLLEKTVAAGWLGRKTGRGFYEYA